MTDCPVSNPWKALKYTSFEGSDNIPLSTAATATGAPWEKPRKGRTKGFIKCLFYFCFACLFWFEHTRKHLTWKIMYANVLNK